MGKRGKMRYVPPVVIDEVEDIKREEGIEVGSDAFRKLVKYAQVGREVKRIISLDFTRKKKKGGYKGWL